MPKTVLQFMNELVPQEKGGYVFKTKNENSKMLQNSKSSYQISSSKNARLDASTFKQRMDVNQHDDSNLENQSLLMIARSQMQSVISVSQKTSFQQLKPLNERCKKDNLSITDMFSKNKLSFLSRIQECPTRYSAGIEGLARVSTIQCPAVPRMLTKLYWKYEKRPSHDSLRELFS